MSEDNDTLRVRCVETGRIHKVDSIWPSEWVLENGTWMLSRKWYVFVENGVFAGGGAADDYEVIETVKNVATKQI